MEIWKECYNHYGYSARNYSNTNCPNCPHKNEDDYSCKIKRENERAVRREAEWHRDWTNYNAN